MLKYRLLHQDEVILEGDEVDGCNDSWRDDPIWKPVSPASIGKLAPDPCFPAHTLYRRKIIEE